MVFDQLPAFQALSAHYQQMSAIHMRDLFAVDAVRFQHFSLQAGGLLLDYSKNRISQDTMRLLTQLAVERQVPQEIARLYAGELLNTTEQRAAAHLALRMPEGATFLISGTEVMSEVQRVRSAMTRMANMLRAGEWLGATGLPITDVVNIGIGGSDLGPALVTQALLPFHDSSIRCHFVSNIDGVHIESVLAQLQPATTLFIVASKSFTTQETMLNALTARTWLQTVLGANACAQHMLAITAEKERSKQFGIIPEHILPIWDWVGGRFSVWSAIGLPVMIAVGPARFQEFLQGAVAMDQHFQTAPLAQNMPVILALLSIWYINFFGASSHAILPYQQVLAHLPAFLQQVEMESNGKSRRHDGAAVNYQTGTVIWGTTGSNGQHAFHQLLHQGTQLIPVDFIIPMCSLDNLAGHHPHLVANCFSQSQALMQGRDESVVFEQLLADGVAEQRARLLAKHKAIPGNRPSNTISFDQLTPHRLGALLAMYEHKIFVQGVLWGINSFDQWGVELGKILTEPVLQALSGADVAHQDASTRGLVEYYLHVQNSRQEN